MPRMTPLVFVSSTTRDLEEHRAAIHRAVLGLDILYRGMELFRSRPDPPRDVMLDELIKCDLYVGIIAHKYGSRDHKTGLSYTELEYRKARELEIPTIIFLMDDSYPVAESFHEVTDEGRQKLQLFKETLSRSHVTEWFTTPEDLAKKVSSSLEKWITTTEPEWRRMHHKPLNTYENNYVRKLHSTHLAEVKIAIEKLDTSSNRIAHEHLYAVLHRHDLPEDSFRQILQQLVHSPDERRVAQILLSLVEDVPQRRKHIMFAIGHRSLIDGKEVSLLEVSCVLNHEKDGDAEVRYEVAHALGKLLLKTNGNTEGCLRCLQRLAEDSDPGTRAKARESLERIPQTPVTFQTDRDG